MKEIRAYIKPHKLEDVTMALHHIEGFTGMTIVEARGCGRGHLRHSRETLTDAVDHVACVRVEVICADNHAESIIEAIERHAHTGLRGDGKICVFPVEQTVRISSGERGDAAV